MQEEFLGLDEKSLGEKCVQEESLGEYMGAKYAQEYPPSSGFLGSVNGQIDGPAS